MKEHITIGKKAFLAPVRYLEGHVCTEHEANQLNRDIIGKARNNLATKDGLTQDELDRWVGNFQFGTRGNGRDPVMAEAKMLARKLVKGKKTPKELAKAAEKMFAKHTDEIMEKARRRVKDFAELSEALLSDG